MINLIKNTKKSFTLIELLIVVAIIGILAGVGIPMYNGYMATAKVESSKTNHANVKSFVGATLTKCAAGSTSVLIGTRTVACRNVRASTLVSAFIIYFDEINKNPHTPSSSSVRNTTSSNPALGVTHIGAVGNTQIRIRSNFGTDKKANYYSPVETMNIE